MKNKAGEVITGIVIGLAIAGWFGAAIADGVHNSQETEQTEND